MIMGPRFLTVAFLHDKEGILTMGLYVMCVSKMRQFSEYSRNRNHVSRNFFPLLFQDLCYVHVRERTFLKLI